MSILFDDLSRIIAKPMPRREAFKLIGGALGGAFITRLGFGIEQAAAVTCEKGESLCGSGSKAVCCSAGKVCCGDSTVGWTCCPSGHKCCTDASKPYCRTTTEGCCCGITCDKGAKQTCCTGASGKNPRCCAAGEICCSDKCCTAGPSPKDPCYKAKC
jgi:hypothetical protein